MPPLTARQIEQLAEKKLLTGLTEEEEKLFAQWQEEQSDIDSIHWDSQDKTEQQLKDRLLRRIKKSANINSSQPRKIAPLLWKAAAVIIPAIVMINFLFRSNHHKVLQPPALSKLDIAPGSNGAVLSLAGGQQLILDSGVNGIIANQHGNNLVLKNGALVYEKVDVSRPANGTDSAYNMVTTPNGHQFQLSLPDGSRVWLNAGSSIRYPVTFAANSRRVAVTGEVYFEVAKIKDAAGKPLPFIVTSRLQQIEVLGTHFNICAYATDAAVKTTLVEGSVRISVVGQSAALLNPNQQSTVNSNNGAIMINEVDATSVIAWTRGFFSFHNADIHEVMEQLARWYNVKIVYEDGLPQRRFSGKIHRDINASAALDALTFMNLHFNIENRPEGVQIRVMP